MAAIIAAKSTFRSQNFSTPTPDYNSWGQNAKKPPTPRAALKGRDYPKDCGSVCPLRRRRPIPSSQKSLRPNKRSHFFVVTVCSTSPLESRRTACVTPCTAMAGFACGVAVTPSFTCAQSMRNVPLSLNTNP
jgi:hypothetical protein